MKLMVTADGDAETESAEITGARYYEPDPLIASRLSKRMPETR